MDKGRPEAAREAAMKKKWLLLLLSFLLFLSAGTAAFSRVYPYIILWSVERELNQLYSTYRPFPYRWPGAPFGSLSSQPCKVPQRLLSVQQGRIRMAEFKLGPSIRSRHL